MWHYILIAYFVLNLLVGLALHLRASWRTLQRPKPMELVVYFIVVLLIGLPLFILMRVTQGSATGPGPAPLELVADRRRKN